MEQRSEAERYLLEEIRRGSGPAWSQLVDRYQGRLLAFARRRAPGGTEAEDLVQDTFLAFLCGLAGFRGDASVETYLFVILRRRLAELYRGRRVSACGLGEAPDEGVSAPARDSTASSYFRRQEQHDAAHDALAGALLELAGKFQTEGELEELQIVELVFYAQWPNQRIAEELNVAANHVALLKHRWLKQLRQQISEAAIDWDAAAALDSLLTEIWENQRPSCPKRSTVGGFVLGTLEEPWRKYVDFHVNRLACSFCRANLEDLQAQSRQDPAPLRQRIMQSTVGFFHKAD